jgi:hypothetical protein
MKHFPADPVDEHADINLKPEPEKRAVQQGCAARLFWL